MISGNNPWNRAVSTDDCYNAFLREKHFLLDALPISKSAHRILLGLFHINPLSRPSLPALRKQILQVDNFFKSAEDIKTTPASADTSIWASTEGGKPVKKISSEVFSGNSQHGLLYAIPCDIQEHRTPQSIAILPCNSAHSSSMESDISDPDSNGPITPATHAAQPPVSVPDLPEEQDIGESILSGLKFPSPPITKPPQTLNSYAAGKTKRPEFFRRAIQIFKDISGSM